MAAILAELEKQNTIKEYGEQRNKWCFLAAVITNGCAAIASMFSKRRPKVVNPDDFISQDVKKQVEEMMGARSQEKTDWASLIQDAREKGLKVPREVGEKA